MTATCRKCFMEIFPFDKKADGSGDYECPGCAQTMKAEEAEKRFLTEGNTVHKSTHLPTQEVVMAKESAIEKLRREAEAEAKAELEADETRRKAARVTEAKADAAKEKEFKAQDAAAAKKAAAKAKEAPKTAEKTPAKATAAPAAAKKGAVPTEFKQKLRDKLNGLEPKALDAVAKSLGVNTKKYAGLQAGLRKMSTVNSCLGSLVRAIDAGELNQNTALAKVK